MADDRTGQIAVVFVAAHRGADAAGYAAAAAEMVALAAARPGYRARWYDRYQLSVATIGRHHAWTRG